MNKELNRVVTVIIAMAIGIFVSAKQPEVRIARINEGHSAHVSHTRSIRQVPDGSRQFAQKKIRGTEFAGLSAPRMIVEANAPGRRPLYGLVTFAKSWSNYDKAGIYQVPTGSGSEFVPVSTSADMAGENAVMAGDMFWLQHITKNMFGTFQWGAVYDPSTWTCTADNVIITEFDARSLAYDPSSRVVYGCFRQAGGTYAFSILDIQTNKLTSVADLGQEGFTSMAFDSEGQLYATTTSGTFGKVDKVTGIMTAISMAIPVSTYNTSAAIDPSAKCYYYAQINDAEAALYSIDLATGSSVKLYDMPDGQNILGLWVGEDLAAAGAPAQADNVAVEFGAGALSGTVSFDMPATLYDGTPATGQLGYKVRFNDNQVAAGTAAPGDHVSEPVTVPSVGSYTVEVIVSNEAGDSPAATIVRWIGYDDLLPIVSPKLTLASGSLHLQWVAPEAANGGFVDASSITYTVTRYPDETVVATGGTATQFEEPAPASDELTLIHYTVTVDYNGTHAAPVASNAVVNGAIAPPYTQNFDVESSPQFFTIVDANTDGYTWAWSSGSMRARYSSVDMDDWLMLPPMRLKRGEFYEVSFKVWAESTKYPEKIALYAGDAPMSSSMVEELMAPTAVTVDGEHKMTVKRYFAPQNDGIYYFGLHGCSAAGMYYLNVDDISVAGGIAATAPVGVENLTAVPAEYGELKVALSCTLPLQTVAGKPLTSISRLDIFRNGEKLTSLEDNLVPGSRCTYNDTSAPHGEVTYTLVPVLDGKSGESVSVTCYVGIAAPQPVENVTLARGSDTGEVIVSWDPVTRDVNGMQLAKGQVTYDVYRIVDEHSLVVASGTGDTRVVNRVSDASDPEEFTYYVVKAFTAYGASEDVESDLIPVGKPSDVPYRESASDAHLSNMWTISMPEGFGAYWEVADDGYVEGLTSADRDNGFFDLVCGYRGYEGTLISGNISLPESTVAPGLTFYYYNYDSTNYIEVLINDGTGFKVVSEATLSASLREGWIRKVVALDEYRGKTFQIAFRGVIVNTNLLALDDIRVGAMAADDMTVRGINAPELVTPGEEFKVDVAVENAGLSATSAYTVTLYENNVAVEALPGMELAPAAQTVVSFSRVMDVFSGQVLEYSAKVEAVSDEDETNNSSETVVTYVKFPAYPAVSDLRGEVTDRATVELTWSEPDLASGVPAPVTDDVEAYEPFSNGLPDSEVEFDDMGDWLVIDGDGGETFVIQGSSYPNSGRPMSFMVLNTDWAGLTGAYSGSQMFACFGAVDADYEAVTCDDWLISPRLYGGVQTVSFYARSMNAQYLERMEMHYTLGGIEKTDFIKVSTVERVESDWTLYEFEVPEGADRFAIHCTSHDKFALLIDDITYIPRDPELADLHIVGYNVYRDAVKLNAAPVTSTAFEDTGVDVTSAHTYHVTTVYDKGESKISNQYVLDMSGISPAMTGGVGIEAVAGAVVITGAYGHDVTVAAIDGRLVFAGRGKSFMRVPVASGCYVVKAGSAVVKIYVH